MQFKNENDWEDYYKYERYRYEFLRRSPQYRQAWEKAKKLPEKAEKNHPGCTGLIEASEKITPYSVTKEGQEEMRLAKSFGIKQRLFDPDVAWGEMKPTHRRFMAFFALRNDAVQLWHKHKSDPENNKVGIEIDFEKINSKDALKKYIGHKIDQYILGRPEFNKKTYWKEYERFLKVGDLKTENPKMTWAEIAAKIYPNETGMAAESAEKKVQQDWKKYKKLINGGHKKITYP